MRWVGWAGGGVAVPVPKIIGRKGVWGPADAAARDDGAPPLATVGTRDSAANAALCACNKKIEAIRTAPRARLWVSIRLRRIEVGMFPSQTPFLLEPRY